MLRAPSFPQRPAGAAPWRWAICGVLVGLLINVVFYGPAGWLAAAVDRATSGRVQLIEARGTVWTGTAQLLLSGGAGSRDRAMLPGFVNWKLRPGWLAVNLQLSADCCTPLPLQGRLTPRWDGASLQLSDGVSEWPVAVLAGLGTPWNTVQAQGSLRLATQELSAKWLEGRLALTGRAELTASRLSSNLTTLKPMGSYRVTLIGGSPTALELATLEGGLRLSGSGRWVGSRLRFEGVASAAPEHEAVLANLLNIIGRRDGARSIITLG